MLDRATWSSVSVAMASVASRYWKELTMNQVRGLGRAVFAAVLLTVGGVLNIIYGIAAIGNSTFFAHDRHYVFGTLKSWGWITLIIGILEFAAALSLFRGGAYGRYFAIAVGCLAAIGALLDIPAYPFWSLAVFGLSLWIIHGLTVEGGPNETWEDQSSVGPTMASQGPRPPM
jgi:hypothetical protein